GSNCRDHCWRWRPTVPVVAWLPAPPVIRQPDPMSVTIGSPTPGIGGNEGVSERRIVNPCTVKEWVPGEGRIVGSPQHSIPGSVEEAAVIREIRKTRAVATVLCRITVAIVMALLVPVIVGIGINILGQEVAPRVFVAVHGERLTLADFYSTDVVAG